MATIKKRTTQITKEAKAKKLFNDLTIEQKETLFQLLGKIACGEVKNFYSTKAFKTLSKELNENQRRVISYICRMASTLKVFENMEELELTEG